MKNKVLSAVFIATVLLTAGCGGPSQADFGNPGQVPSTASAQKIPVTTLSDQNEEPVLSTDGKIASGGTETPSAIVDDQGSVQEEIDRLTDEAKSELKSLFSNRAIEYAVSYNTRVSTDGSTHIARMAYYIKGADRVRVDTIAEGGVAESRVYMLAGVNVMCIRQGPEWSCMSLGEKRQSGISDPQEDIGKFEDNIETSVVAALPDRMVGGVSAKCYQTTIALNDPQAKDAGLSTSRYVYCLSGEGVPLYTEAVTGKMKITQEAESYSTKVADSDLVLPAQVKDMHEALGGNTPRGIPPQVPTRDAPVPDAP